jgi:hypothetical protein
MGFFPAPPPAIDALLKHLAPKPGKVHILDPCAGCGTGREGYDGASLKQIADGLGLPYGQVYGIELDPGRGQKLREEMPGANVLAPCSFFSAAISGNFGLVYANPPFSSELGGGQRDEEAFAKACHRLLALDGVFVLVSPFATFQVRSLALYLDSHFKEASLYRFPTDHCKYGECAYIAYRRGAPLTEDEVYRKGYLYSNLKMAVNYYYSTGCKQIFQLPELGKPAYKWAEGVVAGIEDEVRVYDVPSGWKPSRFLKAGYTDEELLVAISESPLNRLVLAPEEPPIKEPPLPLERGHVAMLLAAGALDGLVETPHGNHVVRGVATKIEVFNEEASDYSISEDGETAKIKEVYSQQITLKVRAVDNTGVIHTYSADGSNAAGEDTVMEHEMSAEDTEVLHNLRMRTVANGCTEAEEQAAKVKIGELVAKYRKGKRKAS